MANLPANHNDGCPLMNVKTNQSEQPPIVGRSEPFPSGRLTFLSPRPLPTGLPPMDHGHAVGEVNNGYLDFGTGVTSVFGWQATLGIPLFCFLLFAWCFRLPAYFIWPCNRPRQGAGGCRPGFSRHVGLRASYSCLGQPLWFLHALSSSLAGLWQVKKCNPHPLQSPTP